MSYQRGELLTGKDRQAPIGPDVMPVTVTAILPRPLIEEELTDMGTRFTVIDSFHSDELNSEYVAGMSYEARDEDATLLGLIPRWIEEGKVREGGPESEVSGTAEATDAEVKEAPKSKTKK